MKKIQALRGMNDLLPTETPLWQYFESTVATLLKRYGYQEIRFPLLEQTELFQRTIGEVTDIVEKEMYTFLDRNGESLSLRPEGTASCVRACEQHQLLYNRGTLSQKLWYSGPMFRYEKPQKGRLRQFHQIGIEAFGFAGPDVDAELLLLTWRLWSILGLRDAVTLQINSLGTAENRADYRHALVDYLAQHKEQLDEDSRRRLDKNPLRILDSKDGNTQRLLDGAPSLTDYLDQESREHFAQLCALLDTAGVPYTVNPRLVRGLDYYGKTVFEWVTDRLGAQGTLCAGGRYDTLVNQLGGHHTPAVGLAMGVERLVLLLEELNLIPEDITRTVDVYIVAMGDVLPQAFVLAEKLREALPELRVQTHCGGGSFKSQMKKADKSGATHAFILGDDEVKQNSVVVKSLREDIPQRTIQQTEISTFLY